MSNFHTLSDAFAELERRADIASAQQQFEPAPTAPIRHRSRTLLVAASVAGAVAISGGVTMMARGDHGSATQAGGARTTPSTSFSTPAAATFDIPKTPRELSRRFRVVLGDSATFTVTDTGSAMDVTVPSYSPAPGKRIRAAAPPIPQTDDTAGRPNGAAIVGLLTAAGISGGFDLQIYHTDPGSKARCDDPDRSRCSVESLADGSSLAVGSEALQNTPGAVTYQVDLIRADGVEFLMHVSNERDPKGESAVLSAHPPLTKRQMVSIVTSGRW